MTQTLHKYHWTTTESLWFSFMWLLPFLTLKYLLRGTRFDSIEGIKTNSTRELKAIPESTYNKMFWRFGEALTLLQINVTLETKLGGWLKNLFFIYKLPILFWSSLYNKAFPEKYVCLSSMLSFHLLLKIIIIVCSWERNKCFSELILNTCWYDLFYVMRLTLKLDWIITLLFVKSMSLETIRYHLLFFIITLNMCKKYSNILNLNLDLRSKYISTKSH